MRYLNLLIFVVLKPSYFSWTLVASTAATELNITQLPVLTVDPNVHTEAFFTGFYCNFDHPEQYQTMLLPVKNGRLLLTCKCTYYM